MPWVILLGADGRENSVTGRTTTIDKSQASVMPSAFDRHQTAERAVAVKDETLAL
jgi:hypothetical protein